MLVSIAPQSDVYDDSSDDVDAACRKWRCSDLRMICCIYHRYHCLGLHLMPKESQPLQFLLYRWQTSAVSIKLGMHVAKLTITAPLYELLNISALFVST